VLRSYGESGTCTKILPCDSEKNSVDQQAKHLQVYEASSSSAQTDAQSICFAVELFLIVFVDLHTPNIQ